MVNYNFKSSAIIVVYFKSSAISVVYFKSSAFRVVFCRNYKNPLNFIISSSLWISLVLPVGLELQTLLDTT